MQKLLSRHCMHADNSKIIGIPIGKGWAYMHYGSSFSLRHHGLVLTAFVGGNLPESLFSSSGSSHLLVLSRYFKSLSSVSGRDLFANVSFPPPGIETQNRCASGERGVNALSMSLSLILRRLLRREREREPECTEVPTDYLDTSIPVSHLPVPSPTY